MEQPVHNPLRDDEGFVISVQALIDDAKCRAGERPPCPPTDDTLGKEKVK